MNTDRIDRSDARKFELYRHEVAMAGLDGKPLEWTPKGIDTWQPVGPGYQPHLDWQYNDYRIAPTPQPTHEAWSFKDAPPVFKVVATQDGNGYTKGEHFFGAAYPGIVNLTYGPHAKPLWITYADLLRDFEQLDGSACGVKREEVEPEWFVPFIKDSLFKWCDGKGVWVSLVGAPDEWSHYTREEIDRRIRDCEWKQIPAHEAHALIAKGGAR